MARRGRRERIVTRTAPLRICGELLQRLQGVVLSGVMHGRRIQAVADVKARCLDAEHGDAPTNKPTVLRPLGQSSCRLALLSAVSTSWLSPIPEVPRLQDSC